jgi:hypothetical protein
MSTPERQQDRGEHGYGGVQQEKRGDAPEHPLEDPEADPRTSDTEPSDDTERASPDDA